MSHRLNKSRKGDYYVLVGPYDAELVQWLKATIPASARSWDPMVKLWRIRPGYAEQVRERIGDERPLP